MKIIKIAIVITVYFISGCAVNKPAIQPTHSAQLVPYGPAWGALWQQRSAEYKALCFQAYNLARERLDTYLQHSDQKTPALVTDVDETVLDNSPYTVHQALKGALYSDSSWMEWTARVVCDTVPGALSFLKYAASRGVQVFYITNRLEAERTATLANLQKWNFPFSDNDHLLMKTNLSSKDERRALVAARYSILLFLGDNLGDFTGIYDHQEYKKRNALVENHAPDFGRQFIVLPNSMYGEWEGAVLNFNNKLSSEKQNDAVLKRLKNY